MKKVVSACVACAMLLSLSACQTAPSAQTTAAKTTAVTTIAKTSAATTTAQTAAATTAVKTTAATTTAATTKTGENMSFTPPKPLFTMKEFPRVDGSTVTIPLSEAIYAAACNVDMETARLNTLHNKTHNAYVNLIEGNADIIFVTYPSEEEFQMAKDAGMELEIVPVVKDAFVFLLNDENPVDELSVEEIRQIYSGFITNWGILGGNSASIIPYQRPVNSGSQSGMLELVMGEVEMMEAPSEMRPGGMGDLIEAVATYDNAVNAIGYSYYYYAEGMYSRETTKYVAVNGVYPSNETVASGAYPFCTAYYAVLNKATPADAPARTLLDFMLSEKGQTIAEEAGYVPLQ